MPDPVGEEDPWDRFDHALALARNNLDAARYRYEGLAKMKAAPPGGYVSALQDLETDIESLDNVLDVTVDDAERAEAIARQSDILADVLDATWSFETALLDVELDVYRTWHASLERVDGVDWSDATAELESVTELAANENYTQLRTGEQFTLQNLSRNLRTVEKSVMEAMDAAEYVRRCLQTVEEFEEQFVGDLKALVRAEASVQLKEQRKDVTDLTDRLSEQLDGNELDEQAVTDARCAIEGAMMLKYYTGHAIRAFEYCQRLADVLNAVDGADESIDGLVETRNVHKLRARVEDTIVGVTTKTDAERIVDLLREHDGSLEAALDASEFNSVTFFESVRTAFEEGLIVDMEVTFE